jgi:hypothetical protein
MAVMITFSGFKLPHYINIIFPSAAVLTSGYLLEVVNKQSATRRLFITQLVVCCLCLFTALVLNLWAFPLKNWLLITIMILLLVSGVFILRSLKSTFNKMIGLSVLSSAFIFFLLNSNFYPRLLTYQAGNELAIATKSKVDPKNVYIWPFIYNPSFQFYSKELKKDFKDTVLQENHPVWILIDRNSLPRLKEKHLSVLEQYTHHDYNIGTMSLKFVDPNTRRQTLDSLFLIRVK